MFPTNVGQILCATFYYTISKQTSLHTLQRKIVLDQEATKELLLAPPKAQKGPMDYDMNWYGNKLGLCTCPMPNLFMNINLNVLPVVPLSKPGPYAVTSPASPPCPGSPTLT